MCPRSMTPLSLVLCALSLLSSRWSSLPCVTLALVMADQNGRFYNVLRPPVSTALPYPALPFPSLALRSGLTARKGLTGREKGEKEKERKKKKSLG